MIRLMFKMVLLTSKQVEIAVKNVLILIFHKMILFEWVFLLILIKFQDLLISMLEDPRECQQTQNIPPKYCKEFILYKLIFIITYIMPGTNNA